jgi:hypothetical protein
LRRKPEQAVCGKLPIQPAMKMGRMRRVEQKDAAGLWQLAQRRLKQRQLAYAFVTGHELDQGPLRPAAPR